MFLFMKGLYICFRKFNTAENKKERKKLLLYSESAIINVLLYFFPAFYPCIFNDSKFLWYFCSLLRILAQCKYSLNIPPSCYNCFEF